MERKLATLRTISKIESIPGADFIVLATVDNWKTIVNKDQFQVGDLCVYCEVDSFLPIRPEFEFLRGSSYRKLADGTEGFRLRTIKLRKQISQGLILPLNILPEYESIVYIKLNEGVDVTEQLGITKWDPPMPAQLAGIAKGNFPSFIPKTDEERIQNLTKYYDSWRNSDNNFYLTEKLDGSSVTFYIKDGVFGVCSRNLDLVESDDNSFWKVAKELEIDLKLMGQQNIALQGELIGEGVQKNPYKLKGQTVRFFNAYDIDKGQYFTLDDFMELLYDFDLVPVPMLDLDFKLPESIDELLSFADSLSKLNQDTKREGIVIRSHNREISFKVISNQFLLSTED